jgi:uncharacterized protein (TIGR03382 family)
MRLIGRVIAVLLLLAAAAIALHDASGWYRTGLIHPTIIGAFWDQLLAVLKITQAAVQQRVPPWLWDNVIAYVLLLWAAPTFAVLGLLFLWQTRRRRRAGTRLE